MKLFHVLITATLVLSITACNNKEKSGGSIHGTLTNAAEVTVYLQAISEAGEKTLDSVVTDKDGKFEMNNPVKEMDYYVFRTDPANVVFLIL